MCYKASGIKGRIQWNMLFGNFIFVVLTKHNIVNIVPSKKKRGLYSILLHKYGIILSSP